MNPTYLQLLPDEYAIPASVSVTSAAVTGIYTGTLASQLPSNARAIVGVQTSDVLVNSVAFRDGGQQAPVGDAILGTGLTLVPANGTPTNVRIPVRSGSDLVVAGVGTPASTFIVGVMVACSERR